MRAPSTFKQRTLLRRFNEQMERGLYIAASGMTSAMVRQDVIANNLANVSTVGFKGDKVVNESFADRLLYNMRGGGGNGLQAMGEFGYGTRVAGTITDFGQGSLRPTEQPLDVAIGGDGFFRVRTEDGTVAYTRNGQFTRSPDGFLTTQTGEYVLGPANDNNPVYIGQDGIDPLIRADGRVTAADGSQLGQIGIATLDVPNSRKFGQNMWIGEETGGLPPGTQLRQRFVEASSVNSVHEMVDMITTLRSYESSQRVITSIDGTLDKAVNSVGSLG
ncbi:MAG: flagellar hook-basal body protein [Thermoleophilia bacterium]|nr:flagellar hook-basal body protein [Thermoleophilia bacterium]